MYFSLLSIITEVYLWF